MAILGLQGAHQFYLGNWSRGISIAFCVHGSMFWFAFLKDHERATGEPLTVVPMLLILVGLLIGLGLFLWDLFTLRKQARRVNGLTE